MLEDYFYNEISPKLFNLLERHDINLTADSSEFIYVDGEEGDYGVIKYFHNTTNLVAIKTVEGGDIEDIEYTDYGKNLFNTLLEALFNKVLREKI